jgi:cation diffusion facilitator family transporter
MDGAGRSTPAMTTNRSHLVRFAWLSIAAAIGTTSIKAGAWWLTGSVGLLSDALESIVNLVAAAMTLWMLTLSARPPTEEYAYGYSKAEYFASGLEGALIFAAALAIAWAAVDRLLHPQALERIGLGLALSVIATAINLAVARVLM